MKSKYEVHSNKRMGIAIKIQKIIELVSIKKADSGTVIFIVVLMVALLLITMALI